MAARKKTATDLDAQVDPKAPLDGGALLGAAKSVLALLNKDLLERADNSPGVTEALKERHASEQKQERTADDYAVWRRNFVEQVAAAWFLSVVFVRTLEDRGLLEQNRIAGSGALDSQKSFFALAPSLTERDYLLTVFRELSQLPAAAELFDAKHNPVWLLGPSATVTQQLLQLFRTPNDLTPAFRFGGDTRFLGDLYQDVSENVRKRYALLQTPRFIESFILDQTLEPAILRFGLEGATLIDPTCGSGHFLLGAFERLLQHRLEQAPGTGVRQAARKALDAVAGADINPYAVAIARFRLTLSFLERAGYTKLKDAPGLKLNLVVADSLLHNPQKGLEQATKDSSKYQQRLLGETPGADLAAWEDALFELEDPKLAYEVLGKRYAAVVGNPPYITVKDAKLRDKYRAMYSAAFREYSLAVPFKQRFFQLGRSGAFVGMITANSFMKREFGKKVIEDFLPSVNLTHVINTSGAYIPGHGTPTVLLFGTAEPPVDGDLLTVLASRGEPSTPDDAEQGFVWRSIVDHGSEVGFENEYVSVTQTTRSHLAKHPWSLGGGGATELKQLLEERSECRLGEVVDVIGFVCMTRADDIYFTPRDALRRASIPEVNIIENVEGEVVRDWAINSPNTTLFPYDEALLPTHNVHVHRFLWPYRTLLWLRREPNGNHKEIGLTWWEWSRFQRERYQAPFLITFAEVATHNHFVLDRGGKVFKQTAPIIKLPASATEDDHYALLAYLNSSTACFWMKQVCYPKGSAVRDAMTPENNRYAFAGTGLEQLPLPNGWHDERLIELARRITEAAQARANQDPVALLSSATWHDAESLRDAILRAQEANETLLRQQVFLQEETDWRIYELFGLTVPPLLHANGATDPNERPFEWSGNVVPGTLSEALRGAFEARGKLIEQDSTIALLENRTTKRLWRGSSGDTGRYGDSYTERFRVAAKSWLADRLEQASLSYGAIVSAKTLADAVRTDKRFMAVVSAYLGEANPELAPLVRDILDAEAVPNIPCWVYSATGLEKHAAWKSTWDLQRLEDAVEPLTKIPIPPAYSQGSRGKAKDFLRDEYWDLRGKLDVPKERFISYPGCESDEDHEPVYGWAGWNHRQRAVALATLHTQRKREEGWKKDRLQPMLAGILELLPWLKQWHNEPDAEFDSAIPAVQFAQFLDAECAEHGFTYEDLRNWRPQTKSEVAKEKASKRAAKASENNDAGDTETRDTPPGGTAETPRKARARKPVAPQTQEGTDAASKAPRKPRSKKTDTDEVAS